MYTTYPEWMDIYYNHLLNMYDIYSSYKKEDKVEFEKFCQFIFKSDFNVS